MINLTRHAKNRMRWRGISQKDVEVCLEAPEKVESGSHGKINAWHKSGSKFLRVTYREDGDYIVVITAVLKKRATLGDKR